MKQKILKICIGQAYDKETNKNLPVYATAWQGKDGNYVITQKVYVQEVQIDRTEKLEA